MDTSYLQSQLNNQNATAARCERQAAQFDALANRVQGTLNYKTEQLRRAKVALSACGKVANVQSDEKIQFKRYAARLDSTFEEDVFFRKAQELTAHDESYARNALSAAETLVRNLEAECNSLRNQIASYRGQATAQRNSAASARNAAYRTSLAIQQANSQQ